MRKSKVCCLDCTVWSNRQLGFNPSKSGKRNETEMTKQIARSLEEASLSYVQSIYRQARLYEKSAVSPSKIFLLTSSKIQKFQNNNNNTLSLTAYFSHFI
jgi:hypothetical protein